MMTRVVQILECRKAVSVLFHLAIIIIIIVIIVVIIIVIIIIIVLVVVVVVVVVSCPASLCLVIPADYYLFSYLFI